MYKEILVKFKDSRDLVPYTTKILNMLVSDSSVEYICLKGTGEVIWTCDDGWMW